MITSKKPAEQPQQKILLHFSSGHPFLRCFDNICSAKDFVLPALLPEVFAGLASRVRPGLEGLQNILQNI